MPPSEFLSVVLSKDLRQKRHQRVFDAPQSFFLFKVNAGMAAKALSVMHQRCTLAR